MLSKPMTHTEPEVPLAEQPPAVPLGRLLGLLAAITAGAVTAAVVLPGLLPGMVQSLLGSEPKAYWYLSRASALVAFALLWGSTLLGLLMTSKLSRVWPGGPTAFNLHQHTSLLALGFALFHGLILLGDQYIGYTFAQIAIPFAGSNYQPLWVGIGQVGFYVMALVGLSFYARKQITQKVWRLIHFASFALFALALLHGITSGTDTSALPVTLMYVAAAASTVFLTIYRILSSRVK
jgi:predicted ferric reductase